MASELCIDFGTSSIRAAYRDAQNERHVLPIGLVTGAKSIDEASIRSEIHIDVQGKMIRYGENAVSAKARLAPTQFYEASPKLWLLQPENLDRPAFSGLTVTRRELLTGLLAYGIFGAKEALLHIGIQTSQELLDIRIAHPVWDERLATSANQDLLSIGFIASKIAYSLDWEKVSIKSLQSYFNPKVYVDSLHPKSDVVEPIAAALELLTRTVNLRQICAVIDVGAGTTDIGLFYSVVTQGHPDRLIPVSSTRSIFKAGNEIDRVLLKELSDRSGVHDEIRLYDVRTRIRQIKEFLFNNGFVQELGVRIALDDFESQPDIKKMAREIHVCFSEAVKEQAKKILNWTKDPQIEIVMAGGGGAVNFIRNVLSRSLKIGDVTIPVRISDADSTILLTYGASRERLAVALGGVNIHYDSLRHEHEKLIAIPSLGKAKQDVTTIKPNYELVKISKIDNSSDTSIKSDNFLEDKKIKEEKSIWREQISKLAKIADEGYVDAQYEIAEKLSNASSQYVKEAMDWYVRAARQGHEGAQLKLVKLLLSGKAIETNFRDAYFWLMVSSRNGSKLSLNETIEIQHSLSISEAENIKNAAYSWIPKSERVSPVRDLKVPIRPQPSTRVEVRTRDTISSKNSQNKSNEKTVSISPFDELQIRDLIRHSSFLKTVPSTFNDINEVIKWSKKKQVFEATFLAKYCGSQLDTSIYLKSADQDKLVSWYSFVKRRGL
jgi:hypothetical protein